MTTMFLALDSNVGATQPRKVIKFTNDNGRTRIPASTLHKHGTIRRRKCQADGLLHKVGLMARPSALTVV